MSAGARVGAALGVVALAAAAAAQEAPAPLRYRFDLLHGRRAVTVVETEQRLVQEVRGNETTSGGQGRGEGATWVRQTLEQRFERLPGGAGRVVQTPLRLEARSQGAATVAWDSHTGEPAPDSFAELARLVGRPVTLDVAATGEVTRVDGVGAEEAAGYAAAFLVFPAAPLRPGQGWERSAPLPMPPLGTLVYRTGYRLVGHEPRAGASLARIEARVEASLGQLELGPEVEVSVSPDAGRGHLLLDPTGLVAEEVLDVRLELVVRSATGEQVQRLRTRTVRRLVSLE